MPRLVLALALACAAVSVPADAGACVNSVMANQYRRSHPAEDALDAGNYKEPARLARRALARLADLTPTPEAWATLAVLRGQRGDVPGQDAALGRCRRMAARPAQCGRA